MPSINRKEIRDFIGDTEGSACVRGELWSAAESGTLLKVEIVSIEAGKDSGVQYHWNRVELGICLRGRGKVTVSELDAGATEAAPKWKLPAPDVEIGEGDTFVIPKGALRRYSASSTLTAPQDPKDLDKLPAKLVLILLHPLLRQPFSEKAGNFPQTGTATSASIEKRNYRNEAYCKYDRVHDHRAIRARIWGRDMQGPQGEADIAKEQLHLTLYTFVPKQVNPGHFHPESVEWVACLQGRASMTVRAKKPKPQEGWDAPDTSPSPNNDTLTIREGDSVLVPASHWHQYVTDGNEDCLLIVSQTPHPVLHILENEAKF